MLVVHVHLKIKPECLQDFIEVTRQNARESLKEDGIARFDLIQQKEDPTRFILIEAYRTSEAPSLHKKTRHYALWRDLVEPMQAEPRYSLKFESLYPEESEW